MSVSKQQKFVLAKAVKLSYCQANTLSHFCILRSIKVLANDYSQKSCLCTSDSTFVLAAYTTTTFCSIQSFLPYRVLLREKKIILAGFLVERNIGKAKRAENVLELFCIYIFECTWPLSQGIHIKGNRLISKYPDVPYNSLTYIQCKSFSASPNDIIYNTIDLMIK